MDIEHDHLQAQTAQVVNDLRESLMNPIPAVAFAVGVPAGAAAAAVPTDPQAKPGAESHGRLRRPARTASSLAAVEAVGAIDAGAPPSEFVERLLIREDGQLLVARLEDVDWIEGDGNYILLHVGETTHRLRCSLGGLAPRLDPRRFVRIHRSAIVHVNRIAALKPRLSGTYDLVLEGGTKLSLSRSHRRKILELLGRGA
jgi:two-component system LytT family response regulator